MKQISRAMAVVICLLVANPAVAQFYVGGHGGVSILQNSDLDSTTGAPGSAIETTFDAGYLFGGVAGFSFGAIRVEGEFTYRTNPVDEVSTSTASFVIFDSLLIVFPGQTLQADGDVDSFAFMVNGWYDFDTGTGFTPYVGGGVGAVYIDVNDLSFGGVRFADDSDIVAGIQAGAGVSYRLSGSVDLTLDYRFLITTEAKLDDLGVEAEYQNHSVRVGLRYQL